MAIEPIPAPTAQPPSPQLYLLRVWPGEAGKPGEPGFRAVLREVGGAEPGGVFSRPEYLADFLRQLQPNGTPEAREEPR